MAKIGYYGPETIRNQIMATNNFAFEVKAILGFESTHQESQMDKIGLNDHLDY